MFDIGNLSLYSKQDSCGRICQSKLYYLCKYILTKGNKNKTDSISSEHSLDGSRKLRRIAFGLNFTNFRLIIGNGENTFLVRYRISFAQAMQQWIHCDARIMIILQRGCIQLLRCILVRCDFTVRRMARMFFHLVLVDGWRFRLVFVGAFTFVATAVVAS